MNWKIDYWRDAWADERSTRKEHHTKPGEIVTLPTLVRRLAPHGGRCTFASIMLNGDWVASYRLDAETGIWRDAG